MAAVLHENQVLPELSLTNRRQLTYISDQADGMNDMERLQETLRVLAKTQSALVSGREG